MPARRTRVAALLAALLAVAAPAAARGGQEPFEATEAATVEGLRFEPAVLDLGYLPLKGARSGTVLVHNETDEPMSIASSRSTCGCTSARLDAEVIPPRESLSFEVTMSGRGRATKMTQRVMLVIAGRGVAELPVVGEVAMMVKSDPALLHLAGELAGTLVVESLDGAPFRVLGSGGRAPVFASFDPAADAPRSRYELAWDLTAFADGCVDAEGRRMPMWWLIETDHPDCPVLDVRVLHDCTRPEMPGADQRWVLEEQRVLLGAVRPGEPVEVDVHMIPFRATRVADTLRAATVEAGSSRVEIVGMRRMGKKMRCVVRITPADDHPGGLLDERLRVRSARGETRPLAVFGRVVTAESQP